MAAHSVPSEALTVKAVLYGRFSPRPRKEREGIVSGKRQKYFKECESIIAQMEQLRTYAEWMKWEVVGEESDADKSGSTVEGRDGLERAIRLACEHQAVLVVTEVDRLSREPYDGHGIVKRLSKCGARFAAIKGGINTTTDEGELMFSMLMALGAYQRKQTGKRTSLAMLSKQERGFRVGGVPYGMQDDPENTGKLIEHPEEQEVIAEIVALADEGKSWRQIAEEVSETRVNRNGNPFSHVAIGSILKRARKA